MNCIKGRSIEFRGIKFAIFIGGLREKSFDSTYWVRKFSGRAIIKIFRPCALRTRTKVHWAGFSRNPSIAMGTEDSWAGVIRNHSIASGMKVRWARVL